MGIEKQSSKSGNYVGGFLQLFDWNAKSRKKLFSSKSDLPEKIKQKKRADGNLPTTRLEMMDEDEAPARTSMKASSVYSCASSVTDEDFYGSKGPGVVARLMGLDPLPKPNAPFPYSSQFSDFHSLPDSYYQSKSLDYRQDPQIMQSKVIQRPIEKFQAEVLPPRSAKTIPVTHHKLLSPIKSKNFVASKDAIHIMEAAARILEPGPQVSRKPALPLGGSSSMPIKVRDLKEKVQAAQKPLPKAVKHKNLQSSVNKISNSGSIDSMSVSSVQDSAEVSSGVKSKGKSISLALQAKANVQKREALSSTSSKGETNLSSPSMLFTSQSRGEKSTLKKTTAQKNSSVLRQNNQKQNCIVDRGKLPLKSNLQGGKAVKGDQSFSRRQNSSKPLGTSKVGSRKSGSEVKDDRSNSSSSTSERVTRKKKRSAEGDYTSDRSQRDKDDEVIQSTNTMDTQSSWDSNNGKGGRDVISFTFTSPMRSNDFQENSKIFTVDSPSKRMMLNSDGMASSKFTFLGHNIKGGESLSSFLELQLKELAHKVDFSQRKSGPVSLNKNGDYLNKNGDYSFDPLGQLGSSSYSLQDSKGLFMAGPNFEGMLQEKSMMNVQKNIAEERTFLNQRLPSPVSVLEHSSFTESCNSSDSADSNHAIEGGNKCSSLQSISTNTFLPPELDYEQSDSVSSTSSKHEKSRSWEFEYVKEALSNIELMFNNYAMGRSNEIINPQHFDQMEKKHRNKYLNRSGHVSSTDRRLIFDCVNECMDMRFRGYDKGRYESWDKCVRAVKMKEKLAEDVSREISRWSSMGDFMVDDLVESDMSSSLCGRWLDYDAERLEVGIQIESRILNSLIDELVADMLVL